MNSRKVAIVGASGYSGEELVRLLLSHPYAELVAVTSRQYAGQTLAQIFPKFANHARAKELHFSEPKVELLDKQADIVFLALPHGVAAEFAVPLTKAGVQVIDLSADFRLRSEAVYKEFYAHEHPAPELLAHAVYGLPEINRKEIREASLVASPGCYPTECFVATDTGFKMWPGEIHEYHRGLFEWREWRRTKSGSRLFIRRMQRKRAALWNTKAPSSFGD